MILTAPQVIILIAPHFDEGSVVGCLSELRQQGISVSLMGVTSGLIGSEHGVTLRPDSSLLTGDRLVSSRKQALVIAGGAACAAAILSDPRSHELIRQILQTDGYVAALSGAEGLVQEVMRPEWAARFGAQSGVEGTAVFAQNLINHIST
ncbi:MAG TPA: DJ-1/PfpI family protein [Chloroflexota bacterium]|nr:DJ-1/PfpI family protein [Chloroflexota bacterium]HUM69214.1 DJ-1/PfpI family protein [Chloroflexota bacterium]